MKTSTLLKAALVAGFAPPRNEWSYRLQRRCSLLLTLVALLVGHSAVGQGTVFYISPSGDDGNNGEGPTQAWATIGKLNSELGNIASGSTVYFHGGETYRGTVNVVGRSGITFAAWPGTGTPVISGSLLVEGTWELWEDAIGNPGEYPIYRVELELPTAPNSKLVHVFADGELMTLARYPNAGFYHSDAITPTSLTDAMLTQGTGYWTGAEIVVRNWNWSYIRIPVDDFDSNQLTYDMGLDVEVDDANWGYFLCNKLSELDQPGEWFYDGVHLYLWAPDGDSPVAVEVIPLRTNPTDDAWNQGFSLYNASDITIRGFNIQKQSKAGVSSFGDVVELGDGLLVEDCTFSWNFTGIGAFGGEDHVYQRNSFVSVFDSGINAGIDGCTIENNDFLDIGLVPGAGTNGYGYVGLRVVGGRADVTGNSFSKIGYTAIDVAWSQQNPGTKVEGNYIHEALAILNDGAGIAFDNCDGLIIRNNIVTGLSENLTEKLESAASDHYSYLDMGFGIYFGHDPNKNVTIEGNVVSNCAAGIHVDHTQRNEDNSIIDNTLFNNGVQLSLSDASNKRLYDDELEPNLYVPTYNGVYSGNILYGLNSRQRGMQQVNRWASEFEELVVFGTFANNFYFNPFSDIAVYQPLEYEVLGVTVHLGATELPWTLEGWQQALEDPQDVGSTKSPLRLKDFDAGGFEAIPDDGLSADMAGGVISTWSSCNGYEDEVCAECEGGYLLQSPNCDWIEQGSTLMWIGPDVPGDLQGFNVVDISEVGNTFHFTFRMRSPDTDAIRFGPVYQSTSYRQYQYLGLSPDWRTYEMVFDVEDLGGDDYMISAFQNVQRSLGVPGNSVVDLDFIRAEACTLNTTYAETIAANHILRYNCPLGLEANDPQNVTSFDLEGCWSDVEGNIYTGTVALDPWESIVLYRLDHTYDWDETLALIDEDITVDEDFSVRGQYVIADGATLTIDGATIGFAASTETQTTNITVMPGGRLVLTNGAKLTAVEACGEASVWDGVIVLGNTMASQAPFTAPEAQGYVEINSGSIIEHAITGIYVGDPNDLSAGGGVVSMKGTEAEPAGAIMNCRTGIYYRPYQYYPSPISNPSFIAANVSAFLHAFFINNDNSRFQEEGHIAHVVLDEINNIAFRACYFGNRIAEVPESHLLGHGIYTIDSRFSVSAACPEHPTACAENEWVPSTFFGLDHGIHTMGGAQNASCFVSNSVFENNICGVYASELTSVTVRKNEFMVGGRVVEEMTGPVDLAMRPYHRAVYTNECNGLKIENNSIYMDDDPAADAEGIVVGYTWDANEVVRGNSAAGIEAAYVGEGVCADLFNVDQSGLQFLCNTNTENPINFWSRKVDGTVDEDSHTIRGIQGSLLRVAENSFDATSGFTDYEVSTLIPLYYHYRDMPGRVPENYSTNGMEGELIPVLSPMAPITACGPIYIQFFPEGPPVSYYTLLDSIALALDTVQDFYNGMIDLGMTQFILDTLPYMTVADSMEVYTAMLTVSPFLSVGVLRTLVAVDILPDHMLIDILMANPEVTRMQGFVRWLEEDAPVDVPQAVIDSIWSSWNTTTARMELEMGMGEAKSLITELAYDLLDEQLRDSSGVHLDSLDRVWSRLSGSGAAYARALLLAQRGDFSAAIAMASNAPLPDGDGFLLGTRENESMVGFLEALEMLHDEERGVHDLDSSEVASALQAMDGKYSRGWNRISNLMCFHYGECRPPLTGGSLKPKMLVIPTPEEEPTVQHAAGFHLYPNPTRDQVTLDYTLSEAVVQGYVRLRDLAGRELQVQALNGSAGRLVLDTKAFAPGLYVVEVHSPARLEYIQTLVVQ